MVFLIVLGLTAVAIDWAEPCPVGWVAVAHRRMQVERRGCAPAPFQGTHRRTRKCIVMKRVSAGSPRARDGQVRLIRPEPMPAVLAARSVALRLLCLAPARTPIPLAFLDRRPRRGPPAA